jgi:hypothetical protein
MSAICQEAVLPIVAHSHEPHLLTDSWSMAAIMALLIEWRAFAGASSARALATKAANDLRGAGVRTRPNAFAAGSAALASPKAQ